MDRIETVREYYTRVDTGDIDWVLALFAERSVYFRADACYADKSEITEFYLNQRKIQGVHTLSDLYRDGDTVIVNGRFDGTGVDGSEKHVGFADFWCFNSQGLVASRRTYLAVGAEVVKD